MKKIMVGIILVLICITIFLIINNKISIKNYSNNDFSIKYDNTWKIDNKDELKLVHKKSNSIVSIKTMVLDDNYIDTNLNEIVGNVIYSIHDQNKDYNMLSSDDISDKYQAMSYMFENDSKNVLVNIYKKDAKLIIVYYEAEFKYYDIVLDSVDSILDSLEIKVGE